MARPVIDLPEPLSPTMPRRSRPRPKPTPRTTSTMPVADREGDAQVRDLEQRRHRRAFGSRTSRRPSPSRLKPSETTKMAMPGMVATHQ